MWLPIILVLILTLIFLT